MRTQRRIRGRTLSAGALGLISLAVSCGPPTPAEPAGFDAPPVEPMTSKQLVYPPPISGGTLLITRDDTTAVAADPERDSVWLVDLAQQAVRARVRLRAGVEPGRVVEDQDGQIHVVLRRGGQVATIDPQGAAIVQMRPVCPAPRGIAYDAATDNLHVACAGGELVTLPARGGDPSRTLYVDRDLRDVVVKGDHLLISRFRSAELVEVDATGTLLGRVKPHSLDTLVAKSSPNTAWRLIALPNGQVAMLHQQSVEGPAAASLGWSNGGPCGSVGIVSSAVAIFNGASDAALPRVPTSVLRRTSLVVDVAVSPDGKSLWSVSPATRLEDFSISHRVMRADLSYLSTITCVSGYLGGLVNEGQIVAVAVDSRGLVYTQVRNPAQLFVFNHESSSSSPRIPPILFPQAEDTSNAGHDLFHTATVARIACASCHPEAGDDSHTWNFSPLGPRRTQSLRGGLFATAPFHWDGSLPDMSSLMGETFVKRMLGQAISPRLANEVGSWLDAQPRPSRSQALDPQASERGRQLFYDATVACGTCHSGDHLSNNQNVDIGTRGAFQVPSLIGVADRAPYMHDGCAQTLRQRFDPACGGDRHGQTSQLTSGQLDDLIVYLETL